MRKLLFIIPVVLMAWAASFLSSCKKDILFSKENLSFSVDTVLFDTVFTTVGSTTKRFKIYNTSNRPVKIDHVILEGGQSSPYRVNLDGVSGVKFSDIVLPANDSLYMFVEVTLGENNDPSIFIIEDKVRFETNGKEQTVQLAAWGQDAYFYNNEYVNGDWYADKPHVIYNLAVVPPSQSLTIHPGTRIHMHKGAMLYVDSSELHIQGDFDNKVYIEGDRLEPFYNDVSGQYYGIYLSKALPSTIDNLIMRNGTVGVHIFSEHPSNTGYTLSITNSEIYNQASYGIFNYSGGRVYGENLNIHSNGLYAYFLLEGGDHTFKHSQFLSYGSEGGQPAVAIKNYFTRTDGFTYIGDVNEGAFYNSIIYGGGDIQIVYDTLTQNGTVNIDLDYNTNLIKQIPISSHPGFVNTIWNQNPQFEYVEGQVFKILPSSPAKDNANSNTPYHVTTDIIGVLRSTPTDIGAYELD